MALFCKLTPNTFQFLDSYLLSHERIFGTVQIDLATPLYIYNRNKVVILDIAEEAVLVDLDKFTVVMHKYWNGWGSLVNSFNKLWELFDQQPRNVEVKLILEASNGGYLYPNFKILSILHVNESTFMNLLTLRHNHN